jgi:uncharacterized protein YqeY
MRDKMNTAMKEAMKAGDKTRLGTLRMINAAIKDRDIEARGTGKQPISDDDILQLLQKMVKQRQESASIYEQNGRAELAEQEKAEIAILQDYMPRQLDEDEIRSVVQATIATIGAEGMKDMGRVIASLKENYAGQMDFAKASGTVKSALQG